MKKIFLPGLFILIFVTGCDSGDKCDPGNPELGATYDFIQEDIENYFPYKEHDSIFFLLDGTDTVFFIGGRPIPDYYEVLTTPNEGSCPKIERFQSIDHGIKLTNLYWIHFFAKMNQSTKRIGSFGIYFYGRGYTRDITNTTDSTPFIVLGKAYSGVHTILGESGETCYFKQQLGIVRIRHDGDIYELIP